MRPMSPMRLAALAALAAAACATTSIAIVEGTPPECSDPRSAEANRFALIECVLERSASGVYVRRTHYCAIPGNRYCRHPRPGRRDSPCACQRTAGRYR